MKKAKLLFLLPLVFAFGAFTYFISEPNFAITYAISNEAEEFISFWRNDVRGKYPDICSVPREVYNEVYLKYVSLSPSAKAEVDKTVDVDNYTIKDSITMLINKFSSKPVEQNFTFDKNTTLTIIIVVGVIGMTSICGFYYMKTKNVIQ